MATPVQLCIIPVFENVEVFYHCATGVNMRAGLIWIVLGGVLTIGIAAALLRPSPPILVGFSGPLTGVNSDLGVQGRNGAQLAIEHINAQGGIAGRQLELLSSDDGPTAESARETDAALLRKGVVAIIGHMTSNQALAGLPVVEQHGAVMISPTASTPLLTGKRDGFFRLMPDNDSWANATADYALAQGLKTVSVIYETTNQAFAGSFVDGFALRFEAGGGSLQQRVPFTSSQRDTLESAAIRALATNPDAIVLAASARDTAALAQFIDVHDTPRPVLLSSSWAYTREIFLAGGKAVEGIVFSISYVPDDNREGYLAFRKAYTERFGWEPNFAAAFAYEGVHVLAAALTRTGGKPQGLREALAQGYPVQGISESITLDQYGDVQRQPYIVTIRNGEFVTIR